MTASPKKRRLHLVGPVSTQYKAPWGPEEVENLRLRQLEAPLHPYTCGFHIDHPLTPAENGWVCSVIGCQYRQDWCHRIDAQVNRWWEL